jgi:hypothetical protein
MRGFGIPALDRVFFFIDIPASFLQNAAPLLLGARAGLFRITIRQQLAI